MHETMRRWEMSALGRANLKLVEAPVPVPSPGELLVKVGAVALNFRDGDMIANGIGGTLPWPFTPASDMTGTVAAVGEGATRFRPGDRVISLFEPDWTEGAPPGNGRTPFYKPLGGFYQGVLSQFLALPEHWFTAAPASLDDAAASTLPCAGLIDRLVRAGRARAPARGRDRAGSRDGRRGFVRRADRQGPWSGGDRRFRQREQAGAGKGARHRGPRR